jgi:hypothetical protein
VDNDSGTGLFYAWYLNGQLAEVSSASTYSFPASTMNIGEIRYVSAIVWQTNGTRAGSANWKVTRLENDPSTTAVSGTLTIWAPAETESLAVRLVDSTGAIIPSIPAVLSAGYVQTLAFDYEALPPGVYILSAWMDGGPLGVGRDGVFRVSEDGHHTYYSGVPSLNFATVITVPHAGGQNYSFTLQ